MSVVLTLLLAGGILAPHGLELRRASPAVAAAIWLSALALRASTVAYLAMYLVLFLPATEAFVARSASIAASTEFQDMGRVGHYMLRNIGAWNDFAVTRSLSFVSDLDRQA